MKHSKVDEECVNVVFDVSPNNYLEYSISAISCLVIIEAQNIDKADLFAHIDMYPNIMHPKI